MKVLDLFSGIGGFSLGLHRAGMETVAFCEIEPYPQAVLRKNFPGVPIYDDVRTITAERLAADGIGGVDLICGGFPCQPFSVAGQQRGSEDHRHLWPEMYRLVQECKPSWVIGENVAGFINMALDNVCLDLENAGYEVQSFVIPACAMDAPHRRDRVWIVAYTGCEGLYQRWQSGNAKGEGGEQGGMVGDGVSQRDYRQVKVMAHPKRFRQPGQGQLERPRHSTPDCNWETDRAVCGGERNYREWGAEPPVGRVANGIPRRMDRLKGLGNAVVPQIPEIIGRAIMQIQRGLTECN